MTEQPALLEVVEAMPARVILGVDQQGKRLAAKREIERMLGSTK